MIALQEELDWQVYGLYDLIDDDLTYDGDPPPLELGQRAFEIVTVRKMAARELDTTWFQRHGSTPITDTAARPDGPAAVELQRGHKPRRRDFDSLVRAPTCAQRVWLQ